MCSSGFPLTNHPPEHAHMLRWKIWDSLEDNTYAFLIQISIASINTLSLNVDVYSALDGPST